MPAPSGNGQLLAGGSSSRIFSTKTFAHPGSSRQAVVLGDPDPARAARLVATLAHELTIIYETDLEALARICRDHTPAAVAVPLDWPTEPTAAAPVPGGDLPLLHFLRAHSHRLPILVYADTDRLPLHVHCQPLAAGAHQLLNDQAPTFVEDLRQALLRLVHDYQAHLQEQEQLAGRFAVHGLFGQSHALRQVFHRAMKACQFADLPVLIVGETGTGKQRLAEAIHALDPRRHLKPFLTINCSTVPKSLAESELFGHTRGAFSGAQGERPGLFRAANGGTLLLDEVGDLDLELQPKLLRVLQERRLLPVGEDHEHPVDVRIIAATNRPLEELITSANFRADLYQRLNVFRIRIPPLRERPEDIDVQARSFLARYQKDHNQPVTDFGPRVLEALRSLPWEGNTRQLENLVREVLVHKDSGTVVHMEDLPRWVLETLAHRPPRPPQADLVEVLVEKAGQQKLSLTAAVAEYERRLLQLVLKQNGGNRTRTAAELGLTARTIFNKIKKYALE